MATGIRQRLLCWWCPQKNRGANRLCLWDRPVFIALVATSAALNFIRKDKLGGSRLLLLAQSLCEIHCQFVYPIQSRLCLGEKCLFVVQTLIKIRISSSVFINRLCMLFYSLFISLCNFDYSVYVYCKHPLSCEAWQWGGWCGNCCMPSRGCCCCCCFCGTGCCCCFDGVLIPLSRPVLLLFLFCSFLALLVEQSSACKIDQWTENNKWAVLWAEL